MTRALTRTLCAATVTVLLPAWASAQPMSRLKGRVVTERGERVPDAEVRVEAFYGYAAGTFAGQRTFTATTNARGEWNVLGIKSGVWLFEIIKPGFLPECVALPIQLLTTVTSGVSGMTLTWDLVLKPVAMPPRDRGTSLLDAYDAALNHEPVRARELLTRIPDDADADYLAGAGRVALLIRDFDVARALFVRALERDPSSYRAALGIATTFVLNRDFDSASRVFDAARNRTHDRDEQKFITIALSDLATIRVAK